MNYLKLMLLSYKNFIKLRFYNYNCNLQYIIILILIFNIIVIITFNQFIIIKLSYNQILIFTPKLIYYNLFSLFDIS